tara:strand:- start:285 stop:893 length:609 start_codon:yes stop_codon:yes gene_type:complete
MWELFNKISSKGITPNQFYILLALKEKVSPKEIIDLDIHYLMHGEYIKVYADQKNDNTYFQLTNKGKHVLSSIMVHYKKMQKKSDTTLMGADHAENISKYREMFPAKKLPSGKPARCNVKTLAENFRWFFNSYDYTWEQVFKATDFYISEYRKNDYLYMKTSQYFISKQDKHKVKHSELADYCDMIKDGVEKDDDFFQEKVV